MKSSFLLKIFCFSCVLVYMGLMILSFYKGYLFHKLWFSSALISLALMCFARAAVYHIDSAFWAAIILASCGVCGYCTHIFSTNALLSVSLYLLSFSYSSFLTFLFFRQQFHLKLFAFLLILSILILSYENALLETIPFAVLLCIYGVIVLSFLTFQASFILRRFKKQ